jgi:hypothetical protein
MSAHSRVLFIGNSLTYFNGGIGKHLETLGSFTCKLETIGGATLRVHSKKGRAAKALTQGWDYAIIQEDMPEYDSMKIARANFFKHGEQFVSAARAAGATPVFYMAWPYTRLPHMQLGDIAAAHRELASRLGGTEPVAVAPVGQAFERAAQRHLSVGAAADFLFNEDMEHPSPSGTLLATLVIYRAITGRDAPPEATGRLAPPLDTIGRQVEMLLRAVASEVASEWSGGSSSSGGGSQRRTDLDGGGGGDNGSGGGSNSGGSSSSGSGGSSASSASSASSGSGGSGGSGGSSASGGSGGEPKAAHAASDTPMGAPLADYHY